MTPTAPPISAIACSTRVVGLGTPHGDDRAGSEAIALLGALPPVTCAETSRDPFDILSGPPGCARLIVIDSCRGAGPVGSIHRFEWPDPRLRAVSSASSHGVGLTEVLELAGALCRLPPRVVVFAVEGEATGSHEGLSATVEAAIPELVARVRIEIGAEEQ